ncbi:DUF779 domain-containing protein [uncultured Helicobacter sp.]|uniref:DUF779 domain-containing protein n=1 Tax=uncultured Helicobacter sp. TaxID=175537 RepID=UPI003753CAD9
MHNTESSLLTIHATQEALALIAQLQERYGEILFHQGGGCCDGAIPMCYAKSDFTPGASDVLVSSVGKMSFYIHQSQLDHYQHNLTLGITQGDGSEFSLEYGLGVHFTLT